MKAALLYGKDDLRIEEIPIPQPNPDEVVVRVGAALTCGTDIKTLHRGSHVMIPKLPSPFGHEFSGVIEAVGDAVEGWQPGEPVVAANSAPCLLCDYCQAGRPNLCDSLEFLNGAYAEFVPVPAAVVRCNLHRLSKEIPPARASLTEPLACVLHGLGRSNIELGQTVCVIGLGPIGLMFVALAARKGARVIAVGRSSLKLTAAARLGAEVVISLNDSNGLDQEIRTLTPKGRGPDVVIEAVGQPHVWEMALDLVKKGGLVNLFGGCSDGAYARIDAHRLHYEEKSIISVFHHTPQYVSMALELLEGEAIFEEELITHRMPLESLHEAFQYMENQRAIKVAIEFG